MRLCIFKCLIDSHPKETELDDIVKIMRSSDRLRALCEKYNSVSGKGMKRKKNQIKKREFPAFVASSLLFEGKGHRHVIGLTNLCFLDIDHLNEKQINEVMESLRQDEHVVLAVRSMSGSGLHLFVKYQFKDMVYPQITTMSADNMVKTYMTVFNTFSHHYQTKLQLPIDESGMNVVQTCNISYDPELYYNPQAIPYTLLFEQPNDTPKQQMLNIL